MICDNLLQKVVRIESVNTTLVYVVFTRHEIDACWDAAGELNGIC